LEEVAKLYQAEYVAQKARKETETKVRLQRRKRRKREHWSTSNSSGMRC